MHKSNAVSMHEITDPEELAQARKQREQFDRNSTWLQNNLSDVYRAHRGKCICISGQEVFAADTAAEAIALAAIAHPDDEGWFTRYVPKEKADKIYAL